MLLPVNSRISSASIADQTLAFSSFSTVTRTSSVFTRNSCEWWKRRNGFETGASAFFGALLLVADGARLAEVGVVQTLSRWKAHRTLHRRCSPRTPKGMEDERIAGFVALSGMGLERDDDGSLEGRHASPVER
jgi:hypothetical protein